MSEFLYYFGENFEVIIDQSKLAPRERIENVVKALHFVYRVDETCTFGIGRELDAAKILIEKFGIANG